MIVIEACPDKADAPFLSQLSHFAIMSDVRLSEGRYLTLADRSGPHRLCLRSGPPGRNATYHVLADEWALLRSAAAMRLQQRLAGIEPVRPHSGLFPTRFQRRRLVQLLHILDLQQLDGTKPTSRHIAARIIYRNTDLGTAAEWKSSSQRRHTLRLIHEARMMTETGYRWLLKGKIQAAQDRPENPG